MPWQLKELPVVRDGERFPRYCLLQKLENGKLLGSPSQVCDNHLPEGLLVGRGVARWIRNTEGTYLALPAPESSARLTVSVATGAALKRAVGCPPGVWGPPYPSPELLRPQVLRALQQFLSGGHAKVTKRKLWPWQWECGRERPGPCPLGMECPWHVCKRLSHRGMDAPLCCPGDPWRPQSRWDLHPDSPPLQWSSPPPLYLAGTSHSALKWPVSFFTSQTSLCGFWRQAENCF